MDFLSASIGLIVAEEVNVCKQEYSSGATREITSRAAAAEPPLAAIFHDLVEKF